LNWERFGGKRVWSGGRWQGGDWGGWRTVFAFLLRGLDERGVGADFTEGILPGGEGEAIVDKSSKESFRIFSPGPR
jgi:hypothetical protein